MRITAQDLKDMNILKYYRIVRKWACKTYGLTDADLELMIYLDHKGRFTRSEFIDGTYTYSWDKKRWEKLRSAGWIEVVSRIYRILLGEEDLPTSERSVFFNNKSYTDKVYNKSIDDMIRDTDR